MSNYQIGVGEMVSFLYASGDLTGELFQNVSKLEGIKAHQYIQKLYHKDDQKEVAISNSFVLKEHTYTLSGRMDGLLKRDTVIIEEIKSTRSNIMDLLFTVNDEHLAQLKCYALLYMINSELKEINARVTYIELSEYTTRSFDYTFQLDELNEFVIESILKYALWLDKLEMHQIEKRSSIEALVFPFDTYRKGQRDMMKAVYHTMRKSDILFEIAPTGIGKTMASLFSTIKTLDDDKKKIFYLTAKTQGKLVALDALETLSEKGLKIKSLEITSKEVTCFLDKRDCNPDVCPFAKGFFDRLSEAMQDIFTNESVMRRETVESYARKHSVCPFEFSLFVSYYVDVIVCDYNYVFDPIIKLIRYFEETTYKPLLLIDEAHNMVSRSRNMYSASLFENDFLTLRRATYKLKPSLRSTLEKILKHYSEMEIPLGDSDFYSVKEMNTPFIELLNELMRKIQKALRANPNYPKRNEIFETYLQILKYTIIASFYKDTFRMHYLRTDEGLDIRIECLDARDLIKKTLQEKTYGSVFFSATLYPITYYQTLIADGLGLTHQISSPFDSNKLKIITIPSINTRYKNRDQSILPIVEVIKQAIQVKKGNYIVFFPSYMYMEKVYKALKEMDADIILQSKSMEQSERNSILEQFKTTNNRSQLGLFVMGGIFSEGIDYVGDMLNGVIIVGVGLPMISSENEELMQYYENVFKEGYHYAYTYPGINKVIQAVGRVIRRDSDTGFGILIDDRFTQYPYIELMPSHWKNRITLRRTDEVESVLNNFYKTLNP